MEGRRPGQPRLPQNLAQLQPDDGDRRKVTVAEVEELVPVGTLGPDAIHTPGIFVKRILQGTNYEKRIEKRTVRTG
ncbi:MAG: CoA-transferase [Rhizomicrobium sp.]